MFLRLLNVNFSRRGMLRLICLLLFALCSLPSASFAGTTGKLAGRVLDKQKQPLPGANVILAGTTLGAAADVQGYYRILNIPPGTYRVQFSIIGYQTYAVEKVLVSSDNTTTLNAELGEETLAAEEVVVVAERPVVETNLTSSIATVTSENIESLPVQELNDVVNLQAGVVDGHFRGGRLGEVQYQINGVTVNNPYDNSSTLRIDRSLLQEVQVISGTFDAEYGQAMSGVVNAVLKSGSEQFKWNAESYFSDYVFDENRRGVKDEFRPLSRQNHQLSVSGPLGLPKTYFILSGRRFIDEGYINGVRVFVPTDTSLVATGDRQEIPLYHSREWSGLFKITSRISPSLELSYQAIPNVVEGRRYDLFYVLNPDGAPQQKTVSLVHGLDWTHTLSKNTFYNVSLRQNYFNYRDYVYEDVNDARYDAAGSAKGDPRLIPGFAVQGVSFTRFKQKTDSYVFKGAVTSQVSRSHLVKVGAELQYSNLQFGTPGLIYAQGDTLRRLFKSLPERPFQELAKHHPLTVAAYAQDQIEWHDLIVRAGLRWEYFDPRAKIAGDLENPANAIDTDNDNVPDSTAEKAASKKIFLAPRLGVSYPISAQAALFFSYGHFYQFPGLGQIFNFADYSLLSNLQAETSRYDVFGNPDLKPERTVQYEFGYKHALTSDLGLTFNISYKDIRDLLGVEFIQTYTQAEYARLTNVDFGNVLGFTLSMEQRRLGWVRATLDYTFQRAVGNSSDPRETATRAQAGEDARPRQVPLSWDQRHTINTILSVEKPNSFSLSAVIRYGNGQPYTPTIGTTFGTSLEANSGRKPAAVIVDMRAEMPFTIFNHNFSFFARGFNVFDARFFNGFVFANTGSPYYSLTPLTDVGTLSNPDRFYPPRRIEVGLTVSSR